MQEMAAAAQGSAAQPDRPATVALQGQGTGITGETELVKRLDEIRKQYNLDSIEDLEKAAKEQGVSFEDFKANIRNQIITQEVMRQEVGEHIQMTPGEVERYYEEHKQDYAQPESERLSEILISTGPDGCRRSGQGGGGQGQGRRHRGPAARRRRLCAVGAELQRRLHGGRGRRSGPVQARASCPRCLRTRPSTCSGPIHRPDPHAAGLHHSESCAT